MWQVKRFHHDPNKEECYFKFESAFEFLNPFPDILECMYSEDDVLFHGNNFI